MSSQRPSAVDLLVSSDVSHVSGDGESCPVVLAVKFAEIEKALRELRSGRMIVIADRSKMVETLGRFPLPIEVNQFGLRATEIAVGAAAQSLGLFGPVTLRMTGSQPFVTDGGHFILDASFGRIPDTRALSNALHAIPGVVEHGLFIGLASAAIIAGGDGIQTVHAARKPGSSTDHDVA